MNEVVLVLRIELAAGSPVVRVVTEPTPGGTAMPAPALPAVPQPVTPLAALAPQYLAWGKREGGRGKRPWDAEHARHVGARLRWWLERFTSFDELNLARVEELLGTLRGRRIGKKPAPPASGKTKKDYIGAMLTFRDWAIRYDHYVMPAKDPLRAFEMPDAEPELPFRALSLDEYRRLLAVASPLRRELYEAMALTGLRRMELRGLKVGWLDKSGGKLVIPSPDTKARKRSVLSLPPGLLAKMIARAQGKRADEDLYPFHAETLSKEFPKDLRRASIEPVNAEGKASLHGMRDTASTLLQQQLGYALTDAQKFLRHASPEITAKRYTNFGLERHTQMVSDLEAFLAPGVAPVSCPVPLGTHPQGIQAAIPRGIKPEPALTQALAGTSESSVVYPTALRLNRW